MIRVVVTIGRVLTFAIALMSTYYAIFAVTMSKNDASPLDILLTLTSLLVSALTWVASFFCWKAYF